MKLRSRRDNGSELSVPLDDIEDILDYYMKSRKLESKAEAIKELVKMGYKYWTLEKSYGDNMNDREVWDTTYRLLKVEGRYLYYRLRLREVMEEMRRLSLILSSMMSELEICYKLLKELNPEFKVDEEKLRRNKENVERYVDEYVTALKRDLNEKRYEAEEDLLKELEDLLTRYKKKFSSEVQ